MIQLKNQQSQQNVELPGKVLEAQFAAGNHFLLFVTEGSPFEEALYIYYLDHDLQLVETLELSAVYAEGMLQNLVMTGSGSMQFSFFDHDERWTLSVLPKPEYFLLPDKYPVKRKPAFFHQRWLKIKKQ